MKYEESLANHFLIAMPSLTDINFTRSVVYIYEHSNDVGAMGLVINKKLPVTLGNVLRRLDVKTNKPSLKANPVFMGGPLGQDHGFIIHQKHATENEASPEILISSSKETLKLIAKSDVHEDFLVTLGHASWEAGKLEEEIAHNA